MSKQQGNFRSPVVYENTNKLKRRQRLIVQSNYERRKKGIGLVPKQPHWIQAVNQE